MIFYRRHSRKAGFTLIEIVIVMSLLMIIASTGVVFGFDAYSRSVCHSERDIIESLLFKTRNRAINNVNKTYHGLHFEEDKYVLFSGDAYQPSDPFNEEFSRPASVPIFPVPDVIFSPLTGKVEGFIAGNILIGNSSSSCRDVISINHEGGF